MCLFAKSFYHEGVTKIPSPCYKILNRFQHYSEFDSSESKIFTHQILDIFNFPQTAQILNMLTRISRNKNIAFKYKSPNDLACVLSHCMDPLFMDLTKFVRTNPYRKSHIKIDSVSHYSIRRIARFDLRIFSQIV